MSDVKTTAQIQDVIEKYGDFCFWDIGEFEVISKGKDIRITNDGLIREDPVVKFFDGSETLLEIPLKPLKDLNNGIEFRRNIRNEKTKDGIECTTYHRLRVIGDTLSYEMVIVFPSYDLYGTFLFERI